MPFLKQRKRRHFRLKMLPNAVLGISFSHRVLHFHVRLTNNCTNLFILRHVSVLTLLQPTGYYTYHQAYHYKVLRAVYMDFICFVWLSEQTVPFALHIINRLVFITEAESVYCAVRTGSLYKPDNYRP
jgi:hypothetical protein